jgi:hypothetical protein
VLSAAAAAALRIAGEMLSNMAFAHLLLQEPASGNPLAMTESYAVSR